MHFTASSLITYLADIPSMVPVSINNRWYLAAAVWDDLLSN